MATITNQVHDVADPYSIVIGNNITVTATFSSSEDLWAEMDENYFKMTNVTGTCTGTITTTTVRSGGPHTIIVHGPNAASVNCSNDVTITAATEQTSPFILIEDTIEDNFVLSGWTPVTVNDKWWEIGRKLIPQICFDTRRDHIMDWDEISTPRSATSGRKLHHVFVVVANPTRAGRWSMECEIRRIFSAPALVIEPADDVDLMYIEDTGYTSWETDKDKKMGCATFFARFEIIVVYHN